jgi:hypothetical protein
VLFSRASNEEGPKMNAIATNRRRQPWSEAEFTNIADDSADAAIMRILAVLAGMRGVSLADFRPPPEVAAMIAAPVWLSELAYATLQPAAWGGCLVAFDLDHVAFVERLHEAAGECARPPFEGCETTYTFPTVSGRVIIADHPQRQVVATFVSLTINGDPAIGWVDATSPGGTFRTPGGPPLVAPTPLWALAARGLVRMAPPAAANRRRRVRGLPAIGAHWRAVTVH